jgi:hypothetical protein
LEPLVDALVKAAGSLDKLRSLMATLVRDNIDRVIQTPKTARLFYKDLQNSEKTYLGTAIELDLRSALGFERGDVTDLKIAGSDVDVKFSQRDGGWMIPPEAVDKVCLLVTADDPSALFSIGMVVARAAYLTAGGNRDAKRAISAEGRKNIWWVLRNADYPKNFWLSVPEEVVERIAEGRSGNQRVINLFNAVQDTPVPRKVLQDVAPQLDFTRRVRADKRRGTRNLLEQNRIFILQGKNKLHQELIAELGLHSLQRGEWMAHQFSDEELKLAVKKGIKLRA